MNQIVLLGSGGHARELLDIVQAVNDVSPRFNVVGFLEDKPSEGSAILADFLKHLGNVERLADMSVDYAAGVGSPASRRKIDEFANKSGRRAVSLFHPAATLSPRVVHGDGFVLAAGARVMTNVRAGRHVHLNVNATVSHDCTLGNYSIVGPGASIAGNVVLEDEVWVGVGATIREGVRVGTGTLIGAGAVVVSDLPSRVTAYGVPARPH